MHNVTISRGPVLSYRKQVINTLVCLQVINTLVCLQAFLEGRGVVEIAPPEDDALPHVHTKYREAVSSLRARACELFVMCAQSYSCLPHAAHIDEKWFVPRAAPAQWRFSGSVRRADILRVSI